MEKYLNRFSEICFKTTFMILIIEPFWEYFEWDELLSLAIVLAIIHQPRFDDKSSNSHQINEF